MSEKSTASSGGIGVVGLLGVVFITLKLCGVINWSWWWVTAPFWGGVALVLGIMAIIAIAAMVIAWMEHRRTHKRIVAARR